LALVGVNGYALSTKAFSTLATIVAESPKSATMHSLSKKDPDIIDCNFKTD